MLSAAETTEGAAGLDAITALRADTATKARRRVRTETILDTGVEGGEGRDRGRDRRHTQRQ